MLVVAFDEFGEPARVLQTRESPLPQPGPGEVRVRMLAAPVNPSDLMSIRGVYGRRPRLPATPGFEGVGIVEANGGGLLGRFLKGRRVATLCRSGGSWAEQVILPARQAVPLAKDLPLEQAAMFFVNPATAYVMTRKVLAVPKGAWLLQTAAASALGRMVIRLGREFGFHTLNVVRRADHVDSLKAEGATAVVVFDGERDDPAQLREHVDRETNGRSVSFAIDPVGGATASAVVGCLGNEGRLLLYGTLSDADLSFSPRLLMGRGAQVEGFWLARWIERQSFPRRLKLVRTITRLMRQKILVSAVAATYPLQEVADAVTAAERPGRGGKVLLTME